jgi:hypothetical protein
MITLVRQVVLGKITCSYETIVSRHDPGDYSTKLSALSYAHMPMRHISMQNTGIGGSAQSSV